MKRQIISNVIQSEIKISFSKQDPSRPQCFTGEFYESFKEDFTSILLKLLQHVAEEEVSQNSLYEISIIITKLDKDVTKIHKANITDKCIYKNSQQNISKQNLKVH